MAFAARGGGRGGRGGGRGGQAQGGGAPAQPADDSLFTAQQKQRWGNFRPEAPTKGSILKRIQDCELWIASNNVIIHGVGKDRILKANLLSTAHDILRGAQGWGTTSPPIMGIVKVEHIGLSLKVRFRDTRLACEVLKTKIDPEFKFRDRKISIAMDENIEQRQERNAGMELVHAFNMGQKQLTARWRRDFDNNVGKIMIKSRAEGNNLVEWKFMGQFASDHKEVIDIGREIRDKKRPPLDSATIIGNNHGASSSSSSAPMEHAPSNTVETVADDRMPSEVPEYTPQRGERRARPSIESTPEDTNFIQKIPPQKLPQIPISGDIVADDKKLKDAIDLENCTNKFRRTSLSPPRRSERFKLKPKTDFRALHSGNVSADTTI